MQRQAGHLRLLIKGSLSLKRTVKKLTRRLFIRLSEEVAVRSMCFEKEPGDVIPIRLRRHDKKPPGAQADDLENIIAGLSANSMAG
jgi:hypothetical protein